MLSPPPPDASNSPILVGLSGGLDSTVLLHLLAQSPLREAGLRAIHVHHGLHPDADAWAAHCETFCESLGVPLVVVRVDVNRASGLGLEGAARESRHSAFKSELRDGEILALAHHRDDQAETFLLRALRGSGIDGLAAMRPWREYERGWLWRPLLDVPRDDLLAYAQHHALRWIDDPSNADSGFDRNFLRNRVMPLLRERWSHASDNFARSAGLAGSTVDMLESDDAHLLDVSRMPDGTLEIGMLEVMPDPRRARILRRWIGELGLPPLPASGIDAVERDMLGAREDASPCLEWAGARIRRWGDALHAGQALDPLPQDWTQDWDGHATLSLPTGDTLELTGTDAFEAPLRVHARQGGERIVLPKRGHSHALKHVLQDAQMPPWRRERLPLLSDADGTLLAAGDAALSARMDAWLRTRGARLRWIALA